MTNKYKFSWCFKHQSLERPKNDIFSTGFFKTNQTCTGRWLISKGKKFRSYLPQVWFVLKSRRRISHHSHARALQLYEDAVHMFPYFSLLYYVNLLAGYSVLATPLLLSPIYDFWGLSRFETRVLPHSNRANHPSILTTHPSTLT